MVNTSTLGLVVQDTDFSYSGLGPQTAFTRTWNADPTSLGMFGRGWGFAYESTLVKTCSGATVTKGSGQERTYEADLCPASGSLTYPVSVTPPAGYSAGYFDKLTYNEGDYWILDEKDTRLKYRYDLKPGSTDTYRLTSITDKNGNAQQIAYDIDGTIKTFTDAAGRVTSFAHTGGRCTSMAIPDGRTAAYTYDINGNMVQNSDLLGTVITYTYDADNYLTSLSYGGRTTTFNYNGSGGGKYIASVKDANGNTKTYSASSSTSTSVTDAIGTVTDYTNEEGRTTGKSIYANGQTIQSTSSTFANGLPVTIANGNGQVTTMSYDGNGNLTKSADPLNHETSFSYDAKGNVTSMTAANGKTWTLTYDGNGNLLKIKSPLAREMSYTYDGRGLLTSRRDGNDKSVSWTYDAFGNVKTMTDANGKTTTLGYDASGFSKTSETDPLGRVTQFLYDGNGRLTRVTYPDNNFKTYTYDSCSLTAVTDENGKTTTIQRNPMLNVTRITDHLGNQTNYGYDANGNATSVTDGKARTTTMARDGAGRLIRITKPSGSAVAMTYDKNDNLITFQDQRGNTTGFSYDGADKPASTQDAAGNTFAFTWNALGQIAARTAPSNATITYTYDDDGRLVGYNSGAAVTYGYDGASNLTTVTDASGTTTYAYDNVNRVSGITYPDSLSLSYTYDDGGNVATVIYPGGLAASYSYNNRNRVASVSWLSGDAINYTYDAVGSVTAETRSNGTVTGYTYDANRRVTKIEHKKGTDLFAGMDYVRDAVGSVSQETLPLPVVQTLANEAVSGTYNNLNQIAALNAQSHTYDAEGNLTGISGSTPFSASYDRENRLTSRTTGGTTTTYAYNGLGYRVQAATAGTSAETRNFHHDRAGKLMFETNGCGSVTVWYIYTGSRLQAIVTPGGGKYFYHFDKTGNTVALTDGNGNVAAGYAYEPFGRIVQKTGTVANPFTFVGAFGVMDEGGGLYFMKNRYFDAQAGKFLQKDPIGIAGGFNLYAYASNNPVDRIDPYGLDDKDAKLPGEGQESVAGFSGVTGQVEYRLPGEDEETWHMVKSGTRLPVGAHIRTQENSKAIISFNDGSMYVLSSESEVILCKPPEKESKIKMVLGNIWENIKKVAKDGTLEVEMNQAIAGTRDDRGDGY